MSERIVNDPSQHGWVEENGKWVWDGTDSGAGMIISETEPDAVDGTQWLNALTGEVFIYDDGKWLEFPGGKDGAAGADGKQVWSEVTEDGNIYYDKGDVGIGGDPSVTGSNLTGSVTKLVLAGDGTRSGGLISTANGGRLEAMYRASTGEGIVGTTTAHPLSLVTDATPRLTIDAAGDATFVGKVHAKANRLFLGHDGSGYGWISSQVNDYMNPANDTKAIVYGYQQTADGSAVDKALINPDLYCAKNIYMGGKLVATVTRTRKDLIETLTTLRNATKDETTLEGLRDSIGNAIGGLIEEFENQIATMPAEDEA